MGCLSSIKNDTTLVWNVFSQPLLQCQRTENAANSSVLKYVGNSDNKKVPYAAQMFSKVSVFFN